MLELVTAGESHGKALVAVLSGMPAGLFLSTDDIDRELARRQQGYGRGARMRIETDRVEVLSGLRHGVTLGSPIALLVPNRDWPNWEKTMSPWALEGEKDGRVPAAAQDRQVFRPRPGHADLAGGAKYGHEDLRNVLERASARATAADVAAGAVCRKFLAEFGVVITGTVKSVGGVVGQAGIVEAIDEARAAGDTLGGIFEIVVTGLPIGLGSHVSWERRLDGLLGQAVLSIPAIKGVEIGDGFRLAETVGSRAHDAILPGMVRPTNHAGGLEGGMTNGQPLVLRAAMKPIATLMNPLPSVDIRTGEPAGAVTERSDVSAVEAAAVVGEARVAFVLVDAWLAKFGGDSVSECRRNYDAYLNHLKGAGGGEEA